MRALTAALPGKGAEQEQAVAPADPVERAPLEAPAAPEETAAAVPEATTTQQAQAFVPVPAMDSYFDYYAQDVLRSQGLRPEIVREYREGYAPTGVVWATDPAPGTPVPEGSTVTVYATPQDQEQVPKVVLPDVSSS
jgi:beta-lactam-binding protein with PASTA domain